MNIPNLIQEFQSIYNTINMPHTFFAPGRINLIGEHTDYNGGYVFPAPISLGTYALAQRRKDQVFRFYSINFPDEGVLECSLSDLDFKEADDWANYPKGMIQAFIKAGHNINSGADILYYGNIPNGAGLSSSASIELVTGVMLEDLYNIEMNRVDMVKIGQRVENNYIGVHSGIMDQFAIGMGKKNHSILLNCNTLEYDYAPIELSEHVIVIIHTNKRRTLAGSKYNERRSQCERALSDFQTELPIHSLGQLTKEEFDKHQHLIKNETHRKRARHVVYENARTLLAFTKLQEGDLTTFGKLMNDSHDSLQYDYEVTGIELDTIVEAARKQEGVLGARMTGAGFGGCAIAIVKQTKLQDFKQNVNKIYHDTMGYAATFYTADIGDGAKKINVEGVLDI